MVGTHGTGMTAKQYELFWGMGNKYLPMPQSNSRNPNAKQNEASRRCLLAGALMCREVGADTRQRVRDASLLAREALAAEVTPELAVLD